MCRFHAGKRVCLPHDSTKVPKTLLLYIFVVVEKRGIRDVTAGYRLLICVIISVVSV